VIDQVSLAYRATSVENRLLVTGDVCHVVRTAIVLTPLERPVLCVDCPGPLPAAAVANLFREAEEPARFRATR